MRLILSWLIVCAVLFIGGRGISRGESFAELSTSNNDVWSRLVEGGVVSRSGSGSDSLVMFSRYDCVYCQKSELAMDSFPELTVVVHYLPNAGGDHLARLMICASQREASVGLHEAIVSRVAGRVVAAERRLRQIPTIRACLDSDEPDAALRRSRDWARRLRVVGTPAFVFDRKIAYGEMDVSRLAALLGSRR